VAEWLDLPPVAVPEDLRKAVGGHPLVATILARRGYAEVGAARAFLSPDEYGPAPPYDLPGLMLGVERVEKAIAGGEDICVWGDFDVDGQTATSVLVSVVRDLGGVARYHIPHRDRGSHGFHKAVVERLIEDGVDLLVTCDTGVRGHQAVDYARAHGVDVVITDHHDLPARLPDALAVINPKMLPPDHPLRELPGVGCAWEVALALYDRAGSGRDAVRHLDLVALGAVADVAVLTGDTRYLVQRGLDVLRQTERVGLRVMMETAGITPASVTEEQIAFGLAPRLNSLGRLADANAAVEFLTTDDLAQARVLAAEMEGLNARRKLLCDQVEEAAVSQVEEDPGVLRQAALVLAGEAWPAGVVGVVAGRLARRYSRPVILLTMASGELARGSARSVEGCDISAAIAAHADMLASFGGHPMAAGLSIRSELVPQFRAALSQTVETMMAETVQRPAVRIDARLPLREVTLDVVEQLERLAPFGAGNPPVKLACSRLTLAGQRTVGRNDEHLVVTVRDEDERSFELIWWQGTRAELPGGVFDLAYTARSSDFRGERRLQLEWIDARQAAPEAGRSLAEPPRAAIVDYREEPRPRDLLAELEGQEGVQLWSEAEHRAAIGGRDRRELTRSAKLVIWTTPPGPAELAAVLGRVRPEEIYLFARDPGFHEPKQFLKRLAGLAKHVAAQDEGPASMAALAAATGQREVTVRAGLEWLAARGDLTITPDEANQVKIAQGSGRKDSAAIARSMERVRELLAETAAFRSHFARAKADTLV
jgi:single-stranded-DNA-specific exonuclease